MNTPHKHAEVIKAWADGATIQFKRINGDWQDISDPLWTPMCSYRVKPVEKTYWFNVYKNKLTGRVTIGQAFHVEKDALKWADLSAENPPDKTEYIKTESFTVME